MSECAGSDRIHHIELLVPLIVPKQRKENAGLAAVEENDRHASWICDCIHN